MPQSISANPYGLIAEVREDLLVDGHVFEADTFYSDNSLVWENEALQDVLQTDWDLLYKSERYASQELGKFSYHIPVENGAYTLKVHFAEIFFGAEGGYPQISGEGRRFMELAVEEERVLSDRISLLQLGLQQPMYSEKELRVSDGGSPLSIWRLYGQTQGLCH